MDKADLARCDGQYNIIKAQQRIAELEERLEIGPQGEDQIDVLEMALDFAKARADRAEAERDTAHKEWKMIRGMYLSACADRKESDARLDAVREWANTTTEGKAAAQVLAVLDSTLDADRIRDLESEVGRLLRLLTEAENREKRGNVMDERKVHGFRSGGFIRCGCAGFMPKTSTDPSKVTCKLCLRGLEKENQNV